MEKKTCTNCGTEYAAEAAQCPVCGSGDPENKEIFQDRFDLCEENTVAADFGIDLADLEGADQTAYNWEDIMAEISGAKQEEEIPAFEPETGREEESASEEPVVLEKAPQDPKPIVQKEAPKQRAVRETPSARPRRTKRKRNGGKIVAAALVVVVLAAGVFAVKHFDLLDFLKKEPTSDEQEQTPELPVTVACTGVTISEQEVVLTAAGEQHQLTASIEPAGCTNKAVWSSTDPSVASVDASGTVTAVSEGETYVLVAVGDYAASCAVKVESAQTDEPNPDSEDPEEDPNETPDDDTDGEMALNATDISLFYPGEQARLSVEHKGDSEVTWSTDNDVILRVDQDGLVTALGTGTTNVYAAVDGKTFTCVVRCMLGGAEGEATSVSLNATDITMFHVGENFQFKVVYENGEPEGVTHTWNTSDESVCTVDENGVVTVAGEGVAYITTNVDGVKLQAVVHVHFAEE